MYVMSFTISFNYVFHFYTLSLFWLQKTYLCITFLLNALVSLLLWVEMFWWVWYLLNGINSHRHWFLVISSSLWIVHGQPQLPLWLYILRVASILFLWFWVYLCNCILVCFHQHVFYLLINISTGWGNFYYSAILNLESKAQESIYKYENVMISEIH